MTGLEWFACVVAFGFGCALAVWDARRKQARQLRALMGRARELEQAAARLNAALDVPCKRAVARFVAATIDEPCPPTLRNCDVPKRDDCGACWAPILRVYTPTRLRHYQGSVWDIWKGETATGPDHYHVDLYGRSARGWHHFHGNTKRLALLSRGDEVKP